jgi:hypothetical protein
MSLSAYFLCLPQGAPDRAAYQHLAVCLAEGFRVLGIPVYGNGNYWLRSAAPDDYLIRHDPAVDPAACTIVLATHSWRDYGVPLPALPAASLRVFLDGSDENPRKGYRDDYPRFDLVLRTHYSRGLPYPGNVRPWAFGLSNRIISAATPSAGARDPVLLVNYRVGHELRRVAEPVIAALGEVLAIDRTVEPLELVPDSPAETLLWRQTGRRHHPNYYRRLGRASLCACFGGVRIPPTQIVLQWDSWRLWESMCAGTAALHIDLERCGAVLPVMPNARREYLAADTGRPDSVVDYLRADVGALARIGREGRAWALAHYAPEPVAMRLLAMLGLPCGG